MCTLAVAMAAICSRVLLAVLVAIATLLLVSRDTHGQLVVRQKDLVVDIGRSAYLDRDDLVISTVRRGESCRVEVVTADPVTQRVGRIHPPVSSSSCMLLASIV